MRDRIREKLDREILKLYQYDLRGMSFPVTPYGIIMRMSNCRIRSYRQIAMDSGRNIGEVIRAMNSSDGCTHYHPGKNRYMIAVNQDGRSKARIRWTVSHELGHILSGHFIELHRAGRSEASPSELDYMEEEADYFAANFLAPLPSIAALHARSAADVRDWFGLSQIAAEYRWNEFLRSEVKIDRATHFQYVTKPSAVKTGRRLYQLNRMADIQAERTEETSL